MIKMVVSDLDGTLLNSDHELTESTFKAIQLLRNKGIIFTIATGRPDQLVKEYVGKLNINEPVIMYNGSVIGHPFHEKRVSEYVLPSEIVRDIINYCEKENIIYMPYTKEMIISKPNYRVDYFEERNKQLIDDYKAVFKDIRDIEEIVSLPIHKILLIENNESKHTKVIDFYKKYDALSIVSSQKGFIDINPSGVNKGKALKELANYYNVSIEDIVVFGDQDNDAAMLEVAGTGVAMANASKSARQAADETTLSNDENGVANWIFNYFK